MIDPGPCHKQSQTIDYDNHADPNREVCIHQHGSHEKLMTSRTDTTFGLGTPNFLPSVSNTIHRGKIGKLKRLIFLTNLRSIIKISDFLVV